jgi:hypothetical protein
VSHTTGVVHDRCPTRQDVQGETKQVSTATGMKPAAHARVTRRFSTRGDANERRVHRRRGWSPIPGGRAGGRGRTRTSAGSSRAQRRSATQPAGRKKGRGGGERVRVCEGTRGREGTQRARRGRCYFLFRFFLACCGGWAGLVEFVYLSRPGRQPSVKYRPRAAAHVGHAGDVAITPAGVPRAVARGSVRGDKLKPLQRSLS